MCELQKCSTVGINGEISYKFPLFGSYSSRKDNLVKCTQLNVHTTLLLLKLAQVSLTRHQSQGRRFRDVTHARVQPSGTRSWHSLANRLFMFDRIPASLRCFVLLDRFINIYPFTTTTCTATICSLLFYVIISNNSFSREFSCY